jgi:hypothetical protein
MPEEQIDMQEEHEPQFEDVSETFFGLTKSKFIGLLVIALVLTINITSFLIWTRIDNISEIQRSNHRAIAHLCVTQTAVGAVLEQAVISTEKYGIDKLSPEELKLYHIEKAQLALVLHDAACDDVVQ